MTSKGAPGAILEWWFEDGFSGEAVYALDGVELGRGDAGFDEVLKAVGGLARGSRLVVRYPLRLGTGGGPGEDDFPFRDRQAELAATIAARSLEVIYQMRQEP